jgi:hypothetical protein
MTPTLRPRFIGLISALTVATGAAALTGLSQAAASDLPAFACTNSSGGGTSAATVSSIRVAHHSGYDRLVIDFGSSNLVPQYEVQRQASSKFTRDASGQLVTLEGSAGVKLVLRNTDVATGVPSDQKPRLPEIREVANIGNFERVVSYGVGLTDQACLRVFQLASPSRLVIDVQTPPDAAPATATSNGSATSSDSQPAASSAPSSQPDSAGLPRDLAMTGHPAASEQHQDFPLGVVLLGLLALTGGLAIAGLTRFVRR